MRWFLLIIFCHVTILGGGKGNPGYQQNKKQISISDTSEMIIEFSMTVNRKIYEKTNYGDPPQIAIWIENKNSAEIRTVWVTHCAGKNEWRGKIECPVALPYWEYRHRLEKNAAGNGDVDVTTGATPRSGLFSVRIPVAYASQWNYFIEVNVSGDYNEHFPYWSAKGMPDSEGNGQPSIIYGGSVRVMENNKSIPELIGRTEQRQPVSRLVEDLKGIENAREVIGDIQVICRKDKMQEYQ